MNEDTQTQPEAEETVELEIQPEEDIEAIRAELAAEREAKKQILARAHAAEQRLKSQKPAPASDEYIKTYVDLRADGYSRADIEFIERNGGLKSLKDENSLVAIALKAKREQRDAIAQAAKVGGDSPASEIERKFSPEELAAMPSSELYKILPKSGN